ncbi:MAG: 4Fe-4S dicluster domain-containing protein [Gammaproteobacteria bacterium]|nr:4Fe-4S dicluster domain-containing protein [Gammaproteobacteria bacterium]MCP5137020.1 4Fe-4S dicluster domain-containing protein [Gammaproteobacteria bacterium]
MCATVAVDPLAGFLPHSQLPALLHALHETGYRCIGPQARDGAIVFDELQDTADLPWGLIDVQEPGRYRLTEATSRRAFAWANGPQAIKPWVFQAHEPQWTAQRNAQGHIRFEAVHVAPQATAILGVRACDLAALQIQDCHFAGSRERDAAYLARRDHLLLIGIHCARSADTCFCVSTGDGPAIDRGADLILGEIDEGLIVSACSTAARRIFRLLPLERVRPEQWAMLRQEVTNNAGSQRRALPSQDLRNLLYAKLDSPHWSTIAERCLSCGNCTAVCPTCFCHQETDTSTLNGEWVTHAREWDSCFSDQHAHLAGLEIRSEVHLRYRQWLLHKLGTWHEQYGRSGCVGCGRCITWCPVGIDLTEEISAFSSEETST